jgi:hypothetical protein
MCHRTPIPIYSGSALFRWLDKQLNACSTTVRRAAKTMAHPRSRLDAAVAYQGIFPRNGEVSTESREFADDLERSCCPLPTDAIGPVFRVAAAIGRLEVNRTVVACGARKGSIQACRRPREAGRLTSASLIASSF